MSFLFRWFWSSKPVTAEEQDTTAELHRSLFRELRETFETYDIADHAERRYDHEVVYDKLNEIIERVESTYEGAEIIMEKAGEPVLIFPTEQQRAQCLKFTTEYLDALVRHKEFVFDNEVMVVPLARKLLKYTAVEGFNFDWHYWQLFRRNLQNDLQDEEAALAAIAESIENDSEDDEFSTSED
jgi:hypothetical protein